MPVSLLAAVKVEFRKLCEVIQISDKIPKDGVFIRIQQHGRMQIDFYSPSPVPNLSTRSVASEQNHLVLYVSMSSWENCEDIFLNPTWGVSWGEPLEVKAPLLSVGAEAERGQWQHFWVTVQMKSEKAVAAG